jgi:rhamnogalacturonan acetylesterase
MKNMGNSATNANYPNDHTHTSPYLADVMSRSFVLGVRCGSSDLAGLVKNTTESLVLGSDILGPCIAHNSSLPVRSVEPMLTLI